MLICCVKTGDKYTDQHVRWLYDGLCKYFPAPFHFVCISDQPRIEGVPCEVYHARLPGWWAKLHCFELRQKLLFFDLDIVFTDNLEPLLDWDGFGIINDWQGMQRESFDQVVETNLDHMRCNTIVTPMFNSSVMKLTGNEGHVWEEFSYKRDAVMSRFVRGGDQRWITARMPDAPTFPADWFASLKLNECWDEAPDKALAVICHGDPKPWADDAPQWIKDYIKDIERKTVYDYAH